MAGPVRPACRPIWPGGRVKVGVVGGNAAGARALIGRRGLAAVTDLVPVRHSYASLEAASVWLGTAIASANRGTSRGMGSALLVDRNQVELSLPRRQRLSAAQQAVVDQARRWSHLFEQPCAGSPQGPG